MNEGQYAANAANEIEYNEHFLRQLAYLNRGNEIVKQVQLIYKLIMNLRKELAKYESINIA